MKSQRKNSFRLRSYSKLSTIAKMFFLVVLPFFINTVSGQSYRYTKNAVNAKWRIAFTNNPAEATILGYRVQKHTDVLRPGLIYLAPAYFTLATQVYLVENAAVADIVIFWVDDPKKAKWIK